MKTAISNMETAYNNLSIGLGLLTSLIRLRGSYTEGVCYSILMMNMVVPMIDRFVRNVSFGGGLKK